LLAEGIDIAIGRQIIRVSHSTITEPCPDFDENVVDASFFTPIMPEHCGRMTFGVAIDGWRGLSWS
jgi:hypothetical protein